MGAGGEGPILQAGQVPDELYCLTQDVTYAHRVDHPGAYDWCIVPNSSYDVVLFGGLAVVLACLLQGKLNTLMVLLAGAAIMAIAWPVNLGALGNSLAIWLGISPWQLFFYVFLPPLLLDAAVRIDWYLFRKSVVQVFTLAFLVVGATCAVMIPIMLYMLDLKKFGWNWIHACMFGAMIASTDAVAIVSVMKTSGGPKRLRVLLEGESLLNDASGLTLFEIFFHILQVSMEHPEDQGSVGSVVGQVFLAVVQFGLIGLVMGVAFGVFTRLCLRFMRYLGASHDQEVALTLGVAYLAYWITAQPCKGSGVVAVAVMGLYGAATNCWDMSTHAHSHFDGFWETLAFVVNSLVFLYSGASVVNFFIRASGDLTKFGTHHNDLEVTLWMLPIIYIILTIIRFVLTMAFRPLFIAIKGDMSVKEGIFVCAAGLRGSASLIMGSAVVTSELQSTTEFSVVKAMMVFWTAGFVLLTLMINAPLLPTVLRLTGLSKVPDKQLARRRRAVAALGEHTATVLEQLRDAEDELLAGVDWAQVAAFVDHGRKYASFTGQAKHKTTKLARSMRSIMRWCCCCLPRFRATQHLGMGNKKHSGSFSSHHSRHHRARQHHKSSGTRPDKDAGSNGASYALESGAFAGAEHAGDGMLADTAVEMSAANGFVSVAGKQQKLDGICEQSADGAVRSSGGQHRQERWRTTSSVKAVSSPKAALSSGTASDDGGSESGNERDTEGSSSDSDNDGDGWFTNVLPGFGTSEIDVLMQECPFMGAGFAAQGGNSSAAGAAAGDSSNAASAAARKSGAGGVSRFWVQRSKKTLLPKTQLEPAEQQQQAPSIKQQQPSSTGEISFTDAAPVTRTLGASVANAQPTPFSAAGTDGSSRPKGPRSLASRSAAPAFVYSTKNADDGSTAPHHARNGSFGSGLPFEGSTAAGLSKPGSWGLAGMAMESAAGSGGGAGEVERSAGEARGPNRTPFQLQTEKALGRQSGVFRGLASRSVNLNSDRYSTAGMGDGLQAAAGVPHVPEHAEVNGHHEEYDAAAAAVDMVSLAQSSRRSHHVAAEAEGARVPAAVGGPTLAGLGRSGSRALASRSVGMTAAYPQLRPISIDPHHHSGSDGDLHGKYGGALADSSMPQPAGRSLATRSQNPHLPPVAPVAPSLHTISTGLNAYTAAATAGAGPAGPSGTGRGRDSNKQKPDSALRSLGARSVPAAQAAAAAVMSASGHSMVSVPATALQASDQLAGLVIKGPGEAAGLGKSSGGLLQSMKKGLGKLSVSLGKGSKVDSAAGQSGDSSDDESGLESKEEVQAGDEELADARHWLVSGLKRYFHAKRMEGLLSARGLRVLDGSCEIALEDPSKPLSLWYNISRDVGQSLLVRVITYALFLVRQASVGLQTIGFVGKLLAVPLRLLASILQRPLNQVLLASVEVAMEYLMGLTTSPYVEWLQEGEVWSALLSEIQCESAQVAKFLIDREIEAPERYSAVQSYRVAMAVLRQQRLYVESLFESGMLDATEQLSLAHPIEGAERRLELLGPVWKAPSLREVLRQLPFMRGQTEQVVDFFVRYGHLTMLGRHERLPDSQDLYIVQGGIVKVSYQPDLGGSQEYFLGAGGVYNLYAALTGEHLPGVTDAVAQGNALGKGPVLFCVSAKGLLQLSSAAAAGDAAFQQLELDMYRLAGLFLLERLRPQLDIEVSQALARMAPLYHGSTHRKSVDKTTDSAAGITAPKHKRISKQQRAAWVRQHLTTLKQQLKQQLAMAELLLLPKGCSVAQESHVMLLQGSIQVKVTDQAVMSNQHMVDVARWIANAGRHQHQSILPWIWNVLTDHDLQHAPAAVPTQQLPVSITAGPEGATLLICPSAAEEAAAAANVLGRDSLLDPAPSAPPTTALVGPSALKSSSASLATLNAANSGALDLQRTGTDVAIASGGSGAATAAGLPAQLVGKQTHPMVRKSLAAAAADSVMDPRPAVVARGIASATAQAAAAAGAAIAGPSSLSRTSPTMHELARISPVRLGSMNPLAGATVDNRQLVGLDVRQGSVGHIVDRHGADAAAAAVAAAAITDDSSSGNERGHSAGGDGLTSASAAESEGEARAAAVQPRRNRSVKPLKPWGSLRTTDT